MDVVFFVQIGFSYGESEHALAFARQIAAAGYRPRFVVTERIAHHVRAAGFEPVPFASPEEGVLRVAEIDPALVIGCELFNASSETVRALVALGRPVATMDGTTLGVAINTDPLGMPGFQRRLELPEDCVAFRCCPVNDVAPDTESVFHWQLFPDARRALRDERRHAALGLDPALPVVLLAIAPWAMNGARHIGLPDYPGILVRRVARALAALGERVQLLVVAKGFSEAFAVDRVAVRVTDLLAHDDYQQVLASCTAIVSDNVIQTSVSKAVVMGTPHLIVQNLGPLASPSSTGQGGRLASELPFRCNMFPLKPLFPAEREYAQIVDVAEYGDAADLSEKLAAVLRVGWADATRRLRRLDYVARTRRLPVAGEIVARLIGPA